jgi:hypothetical protein
VRWPSPLWPLLLLAILSMAQPSGMVLREQARYGIYLRSSPIFCILNVLSFWSRLLLWYRINLARKAVLLIDIVEDLVPEDEDLHRKDVKEGDKKRSTIFGAQGTSNQFQVLRIAVPLLALVSGIKIFSISSIFWTHLLGTCYVCSIIQTYLISHLAKLQRTRSPSPISTTANATSR